MTRPFWNSVVAGHLVGAVCILLAFRLAQPYVGAHPDLGAALEAAQKQSKPLMVLVSSRRCAACRRLGRLLGHASLAGLMRRLVVTSFDAGSKSGRVVVRRLRISKIPTLVFLDGRGRELERAVGILEAWHLKPVLTAAVTGRGTLRWLRSTLSSSPGDHQARLALAERYLARGQTDLAGQLFHEMLGLDPAGKKGLAAPAMLGLARVRLARGQTRGAVRYLSRFLHWFPKHRRAPWVRRLLGRVHGGQHFYPIERMGRFKRMGRRGSVGGLRWKR